jgi:hypothetical protein
MFGIQYRFRGVDDIVDGAARPRVKKIDGVYNESKLTAHLEGAGLYI